MTIRIYHNPRCSKSRKTLQLIEKNGVTPEIVSYLDAPPDAAMVLELARQLGNPVRGLLRTGEDEFKADQAELDLSDDQALASWLASHPRALERPIVVDDKTGRAVMGRPPENVLKLLSS